MKYFIEILSRFNIIIIAYPGILTINDPPAVLLKIAGGSF
jgi:hypothetical protein